MNNGNIYKGIVIGTVFPVLAFLGLKYGLRLLSNLETGANFGAVDLRTQLLIAIICNLIFFQIFNYRREGESMRGVMIMTMLYSISWAIYFQFFSEMPFL